MISLASYAKINLSLELLGSRPDGYTEIRTIFQTVDLSDTLSFEEAPAGVLDLTCDDPAVPTGEENLLWRAAHLLQQEQPATARRGVRISIRKQIPPGAGLGGASSNAAVALVALDRLWEAGLTPERRHRMAARLGSDVPFFLYGGTALGLGRGEEIYPLPEVPPARVAIVLPPFRVRTEKAYERARSQLTPRSGGHTIWRFALQGLAGEPSYSYVINELESAAPEGQDVLPALRMRLRELGAEAAALCGSGSAVFGLFCDPAGAAPRSGDATDGGPETASRCLSEEFPGLRVLRARTLGATAYRQALYGWGPS